jgi:hypothetical protein
MAQIGCGRSPPSTASLSLQLSYLAISLRQERRSSTTCSPSLFSPAQLRTSQWLQTWEMSQSLLPTTVLERGKSSMLDISTGMSMDIYLTSSMEANLVKVCRLDSNAACCWSLLRCFVGDNHLQHCSELGLGSDLARRCADPHNLQMGLLYLRSPRILPHLRFPSPHRLYYSQTP